MKQNNKQDTLPITYGYYQTPAGILKVSMHNKVVVAALFIEDQEVIPAIPFLPKSTFQQFDLQGTPFQIKVWQAVMQTDKIITYQELAQQIGHPKAHRAVANALAQNKIAYFVPCHRVIRTNGNLGGYKWGIIKKEKLLKGYHEEPNGLVKPKDYKRS